MNKQISHHFNASERYHDDCFINSLMQELACEQQDLQTPAQQALDDAEDRYLAENYGNTQRNWTTNQLLTMSVTRGYRHK